MSSNLMIILKCNCRTANSSQSMINSSISSNRTRLFKRIAAIRIMRACTTPHLRALQAAAGTEAIKTGSHTKKFQGIWRFPTIIRAAAPQAALHLTSSSILHSSCISLLCRRLTSTRKICSKKLLMSKKLQQIQMMWQWISRLSSHLRNNKQSSSNKCNINNQISNQCYKQISCKSRSRPSRVLRLKISSCCDLLSAFRPSKKWSKNTLLSCLPATQVWLNRKLHRSLFKK